MYRDRVSWYLGVSSYWFATSLKWFLTMLLMPTLVQAVVPGGEKNTWWGIIVGIGAVQAMIGPALWGYLSDRVGRRMPFLLSGTLITILAIIIIVNGANWWALAIGYLILQVGDDVATGPYAALLPDLVPTEHRGRASGAMGACQFTAQLAGAVLVAIGWKAPQLFVAIAVAHLICLGLVALTIGNPSTEKRESDPFSFGEWFGVFRVANFRLVWLGRFLVSMGVGIMTTFGVFFLSDVIKRFTAGSLKLDTGEQAAGVVIMVIAIMGAISAWSAGKLADRFDRRKLASMATLIMCCAIFPFAFAGTYAQILGLAVVFGLGYGAYGSSDWALAADVMPDEESLGRDLGIWQASIAAPQFFTGLVGRLIDSVNAGAPGRGYQLAFVIAAVAFVLAAWCLRRIRLPGLTSATPQES